VNAPHDERPLTHHRQGGLRVGIIAVVTALLVGGAWRYTRQQISDNTARRLIAEIAAVLPATPYDNEPHKDLILVDTGSGQRLPVYRARRQGAPVGAVFAALAPGGYGGPIRLLVGIAADGQVVAVRVTAHTETPGIGAAVAAEKPAWLDRFAGRSLADPPEPRWALRADGGDFDAIAGATVSSRAVVAGVRRTLQYFMAHRDEIFAGPGTEDGAP
jgi:electron transport complex protein RnfG